MSKPKVRDILDRKELEGQARALINKGGYGDILVELFVILSNEVTHLEGTVGEVKESTGEVRGILRVLVPLTVASVTLQAVKFFFV